MQRCFLGKIKLGFLGLILLVGFFLPNLTQGALVPCGPGTEKEVCELCDFFVLFDNIVDFLLVPRSDLNGGIPIIPLIATVMIMIGGAMFYFSAEDPGMVQRAKSLLTYVVIGLILIYGAWLIVNLFITAIGLSNWKGFQGGWWQINCP